MKKNILRIAQTNQAKERLLQAAGMEQEALFLQYENDFEGYNEEIAEAMREQYGANDVVHQKKDSLLRQLFSAFINPFTVVLIILTVISLITDVILAAPGKQDPTAVIIVVTMVGISGILRFVQEARSGKAAEKLSEMVKTTISVQRNPDGKTELPICELVVGDIIHLAAGDMIPADVRILQSKDLFVSQSSLTGESEPVEKFGCPSRGTHKNPLDLDNLAFLGSNVVSGSAVAMVIAVGSDTIFGSMVQQITGKKSATSFEKGIQSISWVLIRFMMIMVPIVFFLNGFTKGDWMQAFLFALSVAVGLTPEMLPMIVSANLAKSAVVMSREKVIVKNLNAIQNFGAMDILCTDKTGTLTQDKVVLEYSLDIHGNEDIRVLRHAFLNSYHQTGLKNLMDVAILDHANDKDMVDLWKNYRKVDEIPFDFNRRRMSVVVADQNNKTQMITKGAVEEMFTVCSHAEYQGCIEPLTDAIRQELLSLVEKYNGHGMRVLGIAQKTNPSPVGAFSVADETDMVLMGFLAFLDPPKESTAAALLQLAEYGVGVKILTGDSDAVTRYICRKVGIPADHILLGSDIEEMNDTTLDACVEEPTVLAKLSPQQKSRIVASLRRNGHTVGFLGDGINDAAAMKEADVGISVDTAVDIAKESANIILLEKDLTVLTQGVIEGRKTYANLIKYIKMTVSSNFGNMLSVLAAGVLLPFLPMFPIQLLVLNLIYDLSCIAIPWDHVDTDYLKVPRRWDASSITRFMLWMGPSSSVFDIATYLFLYFFLCPLTCGGSFHSLDLAHQASFIALFHAGWFVESLWTQSLVIHMIRTPKIPFLQSRASWKLTVMTALGIAVGTIIPYTPLGTVLDMASLPALFFPFLIGIIFVYMLLATALKKIFVHRYGELL